MIFLDNNAAAHPYLCSLMIRESKCHEDKYYGRIVTYNFLVQTVGVGDLTISAEVCSDGTITEYDG